MKTDLFQSCGSARLLYQSRGYIEGRVREKYYADGEDGLEMKKEL